ncbi:MAG: helix-turn-helix domain-containing protein [Fuerstiella sp.]|nr:helix-turn-helix domain-containing protein [Fuerstiella sp.]MCP4853064.1 helix-turn-helix domain-containing protein [Fuerstiella sp.]
MSENYRGYSITYNPPPIPTRKLDYQYACWDGDHYGAAASMEAAKAEIDEQLEDEAPADPWPLSVAEAASRLGVEVSRVKQMCRKRQLRWGRIGQRTIGIVEESVTQYLEAKTNG